MNDIKKLPASVRPEDAPYRRAHYFVAIPHGLTLDDVRKPIFWAHHAANMALNAIVEIVAEDGTFDAEFRIIGKGVGLIELRPLRVWQAEKAQAKPMPVGEKKDVPEGYLVNFAPAHKWRVSTKDPHLIVSKDHPSEAAAIEAAIAHAAKAAGV